MFEQNEYDAEKLIFDFKSLVSLEEQLKFVILHLYALDKEQQEKFSPQTLEFEKLLSSAEFMRKIKYRDALVLEYSVEYFGNNYGDDDPFFYQEELEKQIIKINMRLLATVGLIAKSMKEKNLFIGDDA